MEEDPWEPISTGARPKQEFQYRTGVEARKMQNGSEDTVVYRRYNSVPQRDTGRHPSYRQAEEYYEAQRQKDTREQSYVDYSGREHGQQGYMDPNRRHSDESYSSQQMYDSSHRTVPQRYPLQRNRDTMHTTEPLVHHAPPKVEIIQCSPTSKRRTYHPGDQVEFPRGYPATTFGSPPQMRADQIQVVITPPESPDNEQPPTQPLYMQEGNTHLEPHLPVEAPPDPAQEVAVKPPAKPPRRAQYENVELGIWQRQSTSSSSSSSPSLKQEGHGRNNNQYENVDLNNSANTNTSTSSSRRSTMRKSQYENVILYADDHGWEDENSSDGSYYSGGSEFDDDDEEYDDELYDISDNEDDTDGSSRGADPLFDCVLDLLQTEQVYVNRLHFICRVVLLNLKVLHRVQDVHGLPPSAWKDIFSNVEEIFSVHSNLILRRLQDRIAHWQTEGQLGDLLLDIIPHLSVYQQYNVGRSMSAFSIWTAKSPLFSALVAEVEKVPECGRLSVKQHMLEIIHRVPKYQAIAKDYIRHLAPETQDMQRMKEAVSQLEQLTVNIARGLGQDERMKKLREVEQKMDGSLSLASPTRELSVEGKLKTIAPHNGKKLDRHVLLLTDMLLICSPASLGGKHKIKFLLEVEGMQVHNGDNLAIPYTFYVQSKRKAIECIANSREDKHKWVRAIQKTIDEYTTWKLSTQPRANKPKLIQDEELGKKRPPLSDSTASTCYVCDKKMKSIDHCNACGQVVCHKCYSQKLPLEYDGRRVNKVCDECFIILKTRDMQAADGNWKPDTVAATDPAKVAGFLQLSTNRGKNWSKRWVTVHHDAMFYTFKSHKDTQCHGSLPLGRFSVAIAEGSKKGCVFKLFNARKTYLFQGDRPEAVQGWIQQLADMTDSRV